MEKEFNVTGSCNPEFHFVVDTGDKINRMANLIEKGKYFTINRPRQYGKSTSLEYIERRFANGDYFIISITFESMSAIDFSSEKNFIREFSRQLNRIFNKHKLQALVEFIREIEGIETFGQLDDFITGLVELAGKPTVLLIDEVDKSSDNQLFLNFLALLRSKYLTRHKYPTFHSVILAGVHDVKTLKLKFPADEERKYNSPWNIAADFNVDLTFTPGEIVTMLEDYSVYTGITFDVAALSDRLYYYTAGHPFLVSKLCKMVDEEILPGRPGQAWSVEHIDQAFKLLVRDNYTTTNFDDMIKNLENNRELYDLVFRLIMDGEKKTFCISNPVIMFGASLGILADDTGSITIHNKVYMQRIYNYLSSKLETSTPFPRNAGNMQEAVGG